jgi:hypothetical protein
LDIESSDSDKITLVSRMECRVARKRRHTDGDVLGATSGTAQPPEDVTRAFREDGVEWNDPVTTRAAR